MFLWFVYIDCHCFTMQCMCMYVILFFCSRSSGSVSRCYHQSEFLFPLHEAAAAHAAPAAVSPDNNAHQSGVERF